MDNTTIITNNSAMDGGGLMLSGDSKLYLQPGIIAVYLIGKSARSTGGAIKVEESNPVAYCITTDRGFDVSNSDCFFQIQHKVKPLFSFSLFKELIASLKISHTILFDNNTAVEAGADLYGGSVDSCTINNVIFKFAKKCKNKLCRDALPPKNSSPKTNETSNSAHHNACTDYPHITVQCIYRVATVPTSFQPHPPQPCICICEM